MIALLHGTVESISEKSIVVMTNSGVGYSVVPAGGLLSQVSKGKTATIIIFTVVREDSITLYGFQAEDEKRLFQQLINISGIGPKAALGLLTMPTTEFSEAIEAGDVTYICRAPGIGKKTAQRLIIELTGKLQLEPRSHSGAITQGYADAMAGLEGLGYKKQIIEEVLKDADKTLKGEDLIRLFLSSNA